MDPYCRIRVGHSVFETQTAVSGSKNPRWSKTVYCYLPAGVDSMFVEIFDERAFTMDDRVAWCHVPLTEKILSGDTVDDWFVLSGKQGEGKEGMINLVLTYDESAPAPVQQVVYSHPHSAPGTTMMVVPGMPIVYPQPPPMTVVTAGQALPPGTQPPPVAPGTQPPPGMQDMQPPPPQEPQGPLFTDEDVQQVKDVFPDTDEEVIKSLLEANRGNKEAAINNLLQMTS